MLPPSNKQLFCPNDTAKKNAEKPEILASLYQIGFNKSIPKPNPVSNEYGKMVKEAYDRLKIEEMREDKEALNLMLPR